jgi:hypothetical protein
MTKQPELLNDDGDLLDFNPPVMEFTNDEEEQRSPSFDVPQIGHIGYADSVGQLTRQQYQHNFKSP